MTKCFIDPPEGSKYGFPKHLPENVEDINKWPLKNGYPKSLLKEYDGNPRYRIFYKNVEDEEREDTNS